VSLILPKILRFYTKQLVAILCANPSQDKTDQVNKLYEPV